MAPQGVYRLRALPDQELADAEGHRSPLGLLTLHGHEPHRRTQGRFADRLGIHRIVLLPLDEGLHVGGWDQPHLMFQLSDLAAPEPKVREAKCAPPQASMAATQRGSWLKNAKT